MTQFLSKLKAFGAAALAAVKNGSWPTALAAVATIAGTVGFLDAGEVSNVKVLVGALLSVLTAAGAVVHGFHVHKLTLAQAATAAAQVVKAVDTVVAIAPKAAATTAPAPEPVAEAKPTTPAAPVAPVAPTETAKPATPPAA